MARFRITPVEVCRLLKVKRLSWESSIIQRIHKELKKSHKHYKPATLIYLLLDPKRDRYGDTALHKAFLLGTRVQRLVKTGLTPEDFIYLLKQSKTRSWKNKMGDLPAHNLVSDPESLNALYHAGLTYKQLRKILTMSKIRNFDVFRVGGKLTKVRGLNVEQSFAQCTNSASIVRKCQKRDKRIKKLAEKVIPFRTEKKQPLLARVA